MLYLNYLYGDSVEVFLDTLQQIGQTNRREIITYNSPIEKTTKKFPRYVYPPTYTMSGKMLANLLTTRQKMSYLEILDNDVLMCLGSENLAMYGNISVLPLSRSAESNASMVVNFGFMGTVATGCGEVYEAEDCTDVGTVTNTVDSDASMGYNAAFSAQNAGIKFSFSQADYRLPAGTYDIFARVKDANQVADDVELEVYNETDSSSLVSSKKTVTGAYDLYTASFTVDSDDAGDTIRFGVFKDTATTNTISVDFLGFARTT